LERGLTTRQITRRPKDSTRRRPSCLQGTSKRISTEASSQLDSGHFADTPTSQQSRPSGWCSISGAAMPARSRIVGPGLARCFWSCCSRARHGSPRSSRQGSTRSTATTSVKSGCRSPVSRRTTPRIQGQSAPASWQRSRGSRRRPSRSRNDRHPGGKYTTARLGRICLQLSKLVP
jgi:hypothetical protein